MTEPPKPPTKLYFSIPLGWREIKAEDRRGFTHRCLSLRVHRLRAGWLATRMHMVDGFFTLPISHMLCDADLAQ